ALALSEESAAARCRVASIRYRNGTDADARAHRLAGRPRARGFGRQRVSLARRVCHEWAARRTRTPTTGVPQPRSRDARRGARDLSLEEAGAAYSAKPSTLAARYAACASAVNGMDRRASKSSAI